MLIGFTDIETTGKNEPEHRIVEVACGLFDLSTGREIDMWVRRSNPLRSIDAKAREVHGIAREDLEAEPTWDLLAPELIAKLDAGDIWAAHNGDFFDFPFIERELGRVGTLYRFKRTFDTMVQARWATGNGKNPTLGELCQCLDVTYDPSAAHSAEYDIRVMAKAFFAARRLGFYEIA